MSQKLDANPTIEVGSLPCEYPDSAQSMWRRRGAQFPSHAGESVTERSDGSSGQVKAWAINNIGVLARGPGPVLFSVSPSPLGHVTKATKFLSPQSQTIDFGERPSYMAAFKLEKSGNLKEPL